MFKKQCLALSILLLVTSSSHATTAVLYATGYDTALYRFFVLNLPILTMGTVLLGILIWRVEWGNVSALSRFLATRLFLVFLGMSGTGYLLTWVLKVANQHIA